MDPKSLTFLPGEFFASYRIVSELARGGQGVVLRAQHPQGAMVALKILLHAEGPAFRRFEKEVSVLSRLEHPGIPRIYETGMVAGRPFVAMQLVEGGSLAQRLKHRGPLPVEETVQILRAVATTLEYCHSLGVYHRDLKPGNIVVDQQSGRPFLVDFGILKQDRVDGGISLDGASRLSMSGEVVGTISYMAPEQGGDSDVPVSPATDVYGLGATLFDLWTGRPPFKGETAYNTLLAVIDRPPPDPRSLRPEIPARAAQVCLRALAKLPEERPQSPLEFVDELEAALDESAGGEERGGGGRSLTIAVGAVALVLVFGLIGALIPVPGDEEPSPSLAQLSPSESPRASLRPLIPRPISSPEPSSTPSAPTATPQPSPALAAGPPGSLHLRRDAPSQARPLVRRGPWILLHEVDYTHAFLESDLAAASIKLPRQAWPVGWDARAGCLVYERRGQSFRVGPGGEELPSPYPTGFGLVEFAGLRVAAFGDGRLVAFDPAKPSPPAWTVQAKRNRALPLPLDLDGDGAPEHLLVCTRAGRALLVNARGKTRFEAKLPSGVDQSAVLLEASAAGPVVLVPGSGGLLLRAVVESGELVELSRVDLMTPLRGEVFPVFVAGEVKGVAASVQHAALTLVDAKVERVEWCGRRSLQREACLSAPAIVDLDRDGTPELAVARFTQGRGSQAWVEVYRLNGEWVTRLAAGARDLRTAPGPAQRLIAAGKKGVWAWGPWESLPEPSDAPPESGRVFANLLGGAWAAVQEDCLRLGGLQGRVYSAIVAPKLGQPDRRRQLSQADLDRSMGPIMNLFGHGVTKWQMHRLFAPPGHPRPDYVEAQPLTVDLRRAKGPRVGVEFGDTIVGHGLERVEAGGYDPQRKLIGMGSWLRFEWPAVEEGPYELVFKQNVYHVKGGGYDEVVISLDGRPLETVSLYYGERGEMRIPLGRLTVGHHGIEFEVRRSSAILRIAEIWVEPSK